MRKSQHTHLCFECIKFAIFCVAVCEIAEQVVWLCLVEDATLFLRYFLEKLTRMNRKEELICVLRKLIFRFPEMPAQTAHTLFNYIVS